MFRRAKEQPVLAQAETTAGGMVVHFTATDDCQANLLQSEKLKCEKLFSYIFLLGPTLCVPSHFVF